MNTLKNFGNSAKELSRNPLGIIALFIVLVYGFACLLFGFSAKHLETTERIPLILFTAIFPVLVLILFGWLVAKHHDKLYGPQDYRSDEAFLKTRQQKIQDKSQKTEASEKDVKDLIEYGREFSIISEQEKRIERDLTSRKLGFSETTAKVLIRHLAACQVLNWFERIYHTLFGSQITLLKFLRDNSSGISTINAQLYFEGVKNKYPGALSFWSLNNYLQFLITSGLINMKDNMITITEIGKEFLIWLAKSGYLEEKAL